MCLEPIDSTKNNHINGSVGKSGFTLIEILVALFILTIIISLIFGSFEGVFSNADHINAASDLYEMGSSCMNRITRDLEAIHVMTYPRYSPPDIDAVPDMYRVQGSQDQVDGKTFSKLRFSSLAHLPLNQDPRKGIAQIVYYVQKRDNDLFVLQRADQLYPYPEFEPNLNDPVVCEGVTAFQLKYFSEEGTEQEEWDSESEDTGYNTPKGIGILLSLGDSVAPLTLMTEVALPVYRFKKVGE